jgi:hypothetical protein
MIVQRGFPAPPSFDSERLLQAPTRHFVDVIAQGHGAMYFASAPPADRWAIAACIRALQKPECVGDGSCSRKGGDRAVSRILLMILVCAVGYREPFSDGRWRPGV